MVTLCHAWHGPRFIIILFLVVTQARKHIYILFIAFVPATNPLPCWRKSELQTRSTIHVKLSLFTLGLCVILRGGKHLSQSVKHRKKGLFITGKLYVYNCRIYNYTFSGKKFSSKPEASLKWSQGLCPRLQHNPHAKI